MEIFVRPTLSFTLMKQILNIFAMIMNDCRTVDKYWITLKKGWISNRQVPWDFLTVDTFATGQIHEGSLCVWDKRLKFSCGFSLKLPSTTWTFNKFTKSIFFFMQLWICPGKNMWYISFCSVDLLFINYNVNLSCFLAEANIHVCESTFNACSNSPEWQNAEHGWEQDCSVQA